MEKDHLEMQDPRPPPSIEAGPQFLNFITHKFELASIENIKTFMPQDRESWNISLFLTYASTTRGVQSSHENNHCPWGWAYKYKLQTTVC